MRYLSQAHILFVVGVAAQIGIAAPITWSLPPVDLQSCCVAPPNSQQGLLSGSFIFDPQTMIYSDWEFAISGFSSPVAALNATLTPATSSIVIGAPDFLHITYLGQQADLVMMFGFFTMGGVIPVPLSSFGGTVPVLISNSARFESFSANGSGHVSAVPEPMGGILVVAGAALLCFSRRSGSGKRA